MAILNVPYVIEQSYETDLRQWKKVYGAVGAFNIVEINSVEAPIAARWRCSQGSNQQRSNSTRWHDESHWVPLEFHDKETGTDLHLTLKAYQALIGRKYTLKGHLEGFTPPTQKIESKQLVQYISGKIPELTTWKPGPSFTTSSRDYALQTIQQVVDDLIVVDDLLWTRCPEPVLTIQFGQQRNSIIVTSTRPSEKSSKPYFRLDRLDDFLDHNTYENPERAITYLPKIEILLPDAFNFNDEKHQLLTTARMVINESKDALHQLSYQQVRCWYDLNETLWQISKNETDDLEQLVAQIDDVRRTFNPYFRDAPHIHRIVEISKHRWDLQPMNLNSISF